MLQRVWLNSNKSHKHYVEGLPWFSININVISPNSCLVTQVYHKLFESYTQN